MHLKECPEGSSYATKAVAKEIENKRSCKMKGLHNFLHCKDI